MIEKQIKSLGCPLGATCQREDDDFIYRCPWYVRMIGTNPQNEEPIDKWGCAISWLPILTVEHSKFERETGAAVESFRNEMVKQNTQLLSNVSTKKLNANTKN